ncbi:MAG: pyridoxal-dependent decarboxylase [bacterium]
MNESSAESARAQAEEIGQRVAKAVADYVASQHIRPITDPTPVDELRELLYEPLPRKGSSHQAVLDEFVQKVAAHTTASTAPGYFGLMNPTPSLMGIFADALASALNQNQGASHHSPAGSVVEETVMRWLGEATGYGGSCHGHLTSGGTVANITGIKLALHHKAPEVRQNGLLASGRRLAVYTSDQVHFSVARAMDVLGLGQASLRLIPAAPDARIDVEAMAARIRGDREEGWEPLAIVGIAGTTAAGSVDPLAELADLAQAEGAWFHVDAAYGGAVGLSRRYPGLLAGIERADSVTVDAHKWFFVPFVAGGILHKRPDHELETFKMDAAYIPPAPGEGRPATDYYQRGIAGSRRFNALKVWMTLKHAGADWYTEAVDRQLHLTRKAAEAISSLENWEVAVPPTTAIVTFRYLPPALRTALGSGDAATHRKALERRDAVQQAVAARVQAEGRFWISDAPLPGGTGLRLNVISYLTGEETIDAFLDYLPGKAAEAASDFLA